MVLGVAAVTTVLFQRLRQPVVLGYVLAGLLVGPHVAFPMFADEKTIHTLSELGVILLMFALGLELRLRKRVELGPSAGITAVIQCSLMLWLGFVLAGAFGWTPLEGLFTGAILAKAFDEQRVGGRLRELVVGILIVEDLIAVLLMTALTAIATGSGLDAGALAWTTGRLVLFLAGFVVVGLLSVPRAMRAVVALGRVETTVVASVVFFVSVGMTIDPARIVRYAIPIGVLTVAVIVGKVVGESVGAFLTRNGTRLSVQCGMSLAQIGELSFIIAGLGLSLNATGEFLYPVAVAVSALTTLTTPWLIRASGPVASFVDRTLPHRLQTFVTLYGSWIERAWASSSRGPESARLRRAVGFLLADMACVSGVVIGPRSATIGSRSSSPLR